MVRYLAVRNLEEFRRPDVGSAVPGGNKLPGIHDLFRGKNPNPITGAPITYTDGRTLPSKRPRWAVAGILISTLLG